MNCQLCDARNVSRLQALQNKVNGNSLMVCRICVDMLHRMRHHPDQPKITEEDEAAWQANQETGKWPVGFDI